MTWIAKRCPLVVLVISALAQAPGAAAQAAGDTRALLREVKPLRVPRALSHDAFGDALVALCTGGEDSALNRARRERTDEGVADEGAPGASSVGALVTAVQAAKDHGTSLDSALSSESTDDVNLQRIREDIFKGLLAADALCRRLRDESATDADVEALDGLYSAERLPGVAEWLREGALQGAATALGGIGSISDKVIEGLANFLLTRAKQEGIRFARKRFEEEFCKTHVGVYLSHTCSTVSQLDERTSLHAISAYLRKAVVLDLEFLPDRALVELALDNPQREPEAYAGRVALAMARAVRDNRSPVEVVGSLHELPAPGPECRGRQCRDFRFGLDVASKLVHAVYSNFSDSTLRAGNEPLLAAAALTAWRESLALDGGGGDARYACASRRLRAFSGKHFGDVVAIARAAGALRTEVDDLRSLRSAGTEIGPGDYRNLATSGLDLAQQSYRLIAAINERLGEGPLQCNAEAEPQRNAKADAATATAAAFEKLAIDKNLGTQIASLVEIATPLMDHDYAEASVALMGYLERARAGSAPVPRSLYTAIAVVVEIANAQSADAVAETLAGAAPPVGQYELKYRRPMLSANAFLGGQVARESMLVGGGDDGYATDLAIFAPVGVHLSGNLGDTAHLGLFVSVLDLGAVTSAQIAGGDDGDVSSSEDVPEVGFVQVLSPGVYAVLGAFELPLVIGAGLSYNPELREVMLRGDSEPSRIDALRIGGFIAMDLTLWNMDL